ncbi:MAG: MFS transporter [Rickettsiaceae bacterium]
MTFITVRLNVLNTPESIIGYIHSAFYGGMLIGAIKSEGLINRVGHIRAYAVFSSIITITIILQAFFQTPSLWVLFRFFAGFSISASYVIIESWLLAQSTNKTKGRILAVYMFCLYLSQAASQFLLDIVDANTIEPFLIAALFSALAIIPSSVTYMKAPEIQTEYKISMWKYCKTAPLGFVGCTAAGLILSSIYGFLPIYSQDNELSVSTMLGITIAGGFSLQWPIGKLSDMVDRVKVLTIIPLVIILVCLFIALVDLPDDGLYTLCFLLGGLCFTIYPVSISHVCDYFEQGNIIGITGALLFSYGIGSVLGSTIVALLIENYTSVVVFYYIIFVSLFLAIFGLYIAIKAKAVSRKDKVNFVALPRATPIANNLDPRA